MAYDLDGVVKGRPVTSSVEPTTYYVRTTGSDITGDGSELNPWQTLNKALKTIPIQGLTDRDWSLNIEENATFTMPGEMVHYPRVRVRGLADFALSPMTFTKILDTSGGFVLDIDVAPGGSPGSFWPNGFVGILFKGDISGYYRTSVHAEASPIAGTRVWFTTGNPGIFDGDTAVQPFVPVTLLDTEDEGDFILTDMRDLSFSDIRFVQRVVVQGGGSPGDGVSFQGCSIRDGLYVNAGYARLNECAVPYSNISAGTDVQATDCYFGYTSFGAGGAAGNCTFTGWVTGKGNSLTVSCTTGARSSVSLAGYDITGAAIDISGGSTFTASSGSFTSFPMSFVDIGSFADHNGTVPGTTLATTVFPHGLFEDVNVTISLSTSYNGVWLAHIVDESSFYIETPFVGDETGRMLTKQVDALVSLAQDGSRLIDPGQNIFTASPFVVTEVAVANLQMALPSDLIPGPAYVNTAYTGTPGFQNNFATIAEAVTAGYTTIILASEAHTWDWSGYAGGNPSLRFKGETRLASLALTASGVATDTIRFESMSVDVTFGTTQTFLGLGLYDTDSNWYGGLTVGTLTVVNSLVSMASPSKSTLGGTLKNSTLSCGSVDGSAVFCEAGNYLTVYNSYIEWSSEGPGVTAAYLVAAGASLGAYNSTIIVGGFSPLQVVADTGVVGAYGLTCVNSVVGGSVKFGPGPVAGLTLQGEAWAATIPTGAWYNDAGTIKQKV